MKGRNYLKPIRNKRHKINHNRCIYLLVVVEEESYSNKAPNKSKQSRHLCVSTTIGISMYLYVQKIKHSVGKNSDAQKSLNSNVQKSGALQRNKNDSFKRNGG